MNDPNCAIRDTVKNQAEKPKRENDGTISAKRDE